jgi:hypothetical protein
LAAVSAARRSSQPDIETPRTLAVENFSHSRRERLPKRVVRVGKEVDILLILV